MADSSSRKKKKNKAKAASSSSGALAVATEQQRQELLASSCIPEQARQTLEAFVMDMREVLNELEAAEEQLMGSGRKGDSLEEQGQPHVVSNSSSSTSGSSNGGGSRGTAGKGGSTGKEGEDRDGSSRMKAVVDQLGLDMATITTFVRLLELQLLGLEGPEGTGPLEDDLSKLAHLDKQQQQKQQGEEGEGMGGAGGGWQGGERVPGGGGGGVEWLRSCLLYRSGQKELVRGYLIRARAELSSTMALLTAAVGDEAAAGGEEGR